MNPLTNQEIIDLLEKENPERVRTLFKDRLDAAGLAFLQEKERGISEIEQYLASSGEDLLAGLPPVPKLVGLPPMSKMIRPDKTADRVSWWRRQSVLFNWQKVTFAMSFAGSWILSMLLLWPGTKPPVKDPVTLLLRTRSGSDNDITAYLDDINEKLFDVLIERGSEVLDHANGDKTKMREALNDFLQAHQLNPKSPRILEHLSMVYEELGEEIKAQEFEEKIMALERDDAAIKQ